MYTFDVQRTIRVAKGLEKFWSSSHGWAPSSAADLLAEARLDRQTSFAHTLPDYLIPFPPESADARLILGYTALRSLSEGLLKLFFSVWFEDYRKDADAVRSQTGSLIFPEDAKLDRLIRLFVKKVGFEFEAFLRRVQHRGNGIHHFADRDMGTQQELIEDIYCFGEFMLTLNESLPYPDEAYNPARL